MKKSIFPVIVVSTIYLVISCKLPSDSVSSISQSTESARARTEGQLGLTLAAKQAIQTNLVDPSLRSDYEVTGGILHFKDLDTYLKFRNELRKLSVPERIKKTQFTGFTSLLSLYQDFLEKTEKNEDTKSFQDIISSVNQDNKQEFLNTDFVVAALINRAGLVYIGKILYRFTDKNEEIVFDGDQSKLGTTNQMVHKINDVTTPLAKQARMAIGDFCGQSWKAKNSTDGQRRIALDIKMKNANYVTGSITVGPMSGAIYTIEAQPTAFAVPYKLKSNGWEWVNYNTTNHLKSAWSFSVARADNNQVQSCYDNYEYWNYFNWIDYRGTILTFYNVPGLYAYNNYVYSNTLIPTFQFDGGYYYTDGVPEAQKLYMECP